MPLTKADELLLFNLAEYGILLIDQIALLNQTGKRIAQKRVSQLYKNKVMLLSPMAYSNYIERPQKKFL